MVPPVKTVTILGKKQINDGRVLYSFYTEIQRIHECNETQGDGEFFLLLGCDAQATITVVVHNFLCKERPRLFSKRILHTVSA